METMKIRDKLINGNYDTGVKHEVANICRDFSNQNSKCSQWDTQGPGES
jgi:hypothetical protein